MKITVNGDNLELAGSTIADLLTQLSLSDRWLAVEANRDLLPKSQHAQFRLQDGDVVEIVHAIGGG